MWQLAVHCRKCATITCSNSVAKNNLALFKMSSSIMLYSIYHEFTCIEIEGDS